VYDEAGKMSAAKQQHRLSTLIWLRTEASARQFRQQEGVMVFENIL
jgi:hypothetical protein